MVVTYQGAIVVEPKYGWAIAGETTLVRDSLTYGWKTTTWKGREWIGLPSIKPRPHAREQSHRRAASVLALWPENYFHFVMDVLPKLVLLDKSGHLADVDHVLIAQELAATEFFQGARQSGRLSEVPFLPLREEIVVGHLAVAHSRAIDKPMVRSLRELVDGEGLSDSSLPDRFFVTRAPARGRLPTNIARVERIFTEYGFTILDLDGMTFSDQVSLFRNARYVAAIHGASLANLVWCEQQPWVIELVPNIPTGEFDCFRLLCDTLDLPYERILGANQSYAHKRADFDVDTSDIVRAIERTLRP